MEGRHCVAGDVHGSLATVPEKNGQSIKWRGLKRYLLKDLLYLMVEQI
jgi:hypothetical protein